MTTKNTRTYTVVFMKQIGQGITSITIPDYYRQYKDKRSAYRAMSKHYAETSNEAFLTRSDKRNSHKRKQPLAQNETDVTSAFNALLGNANERLQEITLLTSR